MKHLSGLFAIFFAGCATQFQISGPYAASLSESDVQQIRRLAYTRTHYQYIRVEALGPARVRLDKTRLEGSSTISTDVYAERRSGTWTVVERPAITSPVERVILY